MNVAKFLNIGTFLCIGCLIAIQFYLIILVITEFKDFRRMGYPFLALNFFLMMFWLFSLIVYISTD